jgi:sodium pump decarboxylase gamma subunit
MIFEGVKLMVVGMTTVMLFLLLMIFFINLVAFLTRGAAAREIQAIANDRAILASKRKKVKEEPVPVSDGGVEFAVIAAAAAAYESEMCVQE